ncbi:caveolin-2-like [Arctopsyche grandis]|uniref:caveolin-2-like n=1 Tax=Arctopsyche grandis TaxID=121162 RepID=UPI00406D9884
MFNFEEDMDDSNHRDPRDLNRHIQVDFNDVLGEPDGVRSLKCSWIFNKFFYKFANISVYIVLSLLVGPILAFCWGIVYGIVAFLWIWVVGPTTRLVTLAFGTIYNLTRPCTQAVIAPCFEACGALFSNIRLKHYSLNNLPEKDAPFLV